MTSQIHGFPPFHLSGSLLSPSSGQKVDHSCRLSSFVPLSIDHFSLFQG